LADHPRPSARLQATIVLPFQGPDFAEAVDAAADWFDGTDYHGRDGTWAARTLRSSPRTFRSDSRPSYGHETRPSQLPAIAHPSKAPFVDTHHFAGIAYQGDIDDFLLDSLRYSMSSELADRLRAKDLHPDDNERWARDWTSRETTAPGLPDDGDFVGAHRRIRGHDRRALGDRLGDQHPVKRVTVVRRQRSGGVGMRHRYRQLDSAASNQFGDEPGPGGELAQGGLDRDLPSDRGAEQHLVATI
jgi:hypothetical protein